MRPLFRGLAVVSALGLLGLYVLQAQQNATPTPTAEAREAERLQKPSMASGSKALAPGTIAPGSKSGRIVPPRPKPELVAPGSKAMILPGSKSGDVRSPLGQAQGTPVPSPTPTVGVTPTPTVATTPLPVPTLTPTPGPLK